MLLQNLPRWTLLIFLSTLTGHWFILQAITALGNRWAEPPPALPSRHQEAKPCWRRLSGNLPDRRNFAQLCKGILDGKSRAVFNGKIFVRPGAQKTDAMQTNKNLLLSNEARVDTKPQLEILADDVKCAHGAAVGQIDQDELFYLETRGLNPELARNLLTYGFAEEVIAKIKIDSLRTQIDELVLHHLKARLEV